MLRRSTTQVKAANQAVIAAGLRGDQQAFATLVADELQWIRATGEVLGKAEFTKTINPGIARSQWTFTEESVAVYGDITLLVCRSDFISQGQKRAERVLRAFTRRDRQWLLLRHAADTVGAMTIVASQAGTTFAQAKRLPYLACSLARRGAASGCCNKPGSKIVGSIFIAFRGP